MNSYVIFKDFEADKIKRYFFLKDLDELKGSFSAECLEIHNYFIEFLFNSKVFNLFMEKKMFSNNILDNFHAINDSIRTEFLASINDKNENFNILSSKNYERIYSNIWSNLISFVQKRLSGSVMKIFFPNDCNLSSQICIKAAILTHLFLNNAVVCPTCNGQFFGVNTEKICGMAHDVNFYFFREFVDNYFSQNSIACLKCGYQNKINLSTLYSSINKNLNKTKIKKDVTIYDFL